MRGRISRYHEIRTIYQHGFNKIVLSKCIDDNQEYILKHIQIAQRDQAQIVKEGEINLTIKHPNIVQIKETFQYSIDAERYYVIVMEYCREGNLDNMIGDDTKAAMIGTIMEDVALAVQYLHKMNIVHRDLKPENILLQNTRAKVSDLGLAKVIKANKSKTKTGVRGTFFYLAPEIIQQSHYDLGVDVWGLGIIFLELLSGCRLSDLIFGSAEPALREDFPNEQTLIRVSSPLMKRLIVKMLIKDRSKRIKINEVIDILAENNLKQVINVANDNNLIFGIVESNFAKANGILLSRNLVLVCARVVYHRQTEQNAISVKFCLNSICSSSFAYEAYEEYKMQPNKREKEILCKYNYALLLTETNYEPPSADYPSLIKDYDHEIVSKIPNVSLFVGNRELKFTELQIESKLILIETEILGNCCGLPLYFKLIDKRCFVFGMCCGVKDSSNRQIAVFINQNVINNIMEMKHKWSQIQIISIKTESLHKITSPNSGTLIPINDKQYQKLRKQYELKKYIFGDSVDTAIAAEQFARYCKDIGEFKQSQLYFTEACESLVKHKGEKDQLYGHFLHNFANLYRLKAEYAKALQLYLKAHSINMFNCPQGNEGVTKTISLIAKTAIDLNNRSLAIEYYEKAIPIMQRLGQIEKLEEASYYLGKIYLMWQNSDKCLKLFENVIQYASISRGQNNQQSVNCYMMMAQYYTDNANFTEALRVIRKALRIAKSAEIILTQTFNDAQNKAKNHMVKMMVAGLSQDQFQLAYEIAIENDLGPKMVENIAKQRNK